MTMGTEKDWTLKGTFHECCRMEGVCPFGFHRDMRDEGCEDMNAFRIKEGHVGDVDMSGLTVMFYQNGIGPKCDDLLSGKKGSIDEGAWYISDNATEEQIEVLKSFLPMHMGAQLWNTCHGVKVVKIEIKEQDGTYHITMPYGEMKMALTVGGDGKNPVSITNPVGRLATASNIKVCDGIMWRYHDYGKNVEYHSTSSLMADFYYIGE